MAGITVAQLAQVEKDPLAKWIDIQLLRECKVMNFLPFQNVDTLRVSAQYWTKLPTGGTWRKINEGFASAEDGQLGEATENLYGFGGDITFDNVISKIATIKDPVQLQTEGKLKSMALQWNENFINGDVADDEDAFEGLKKRVAAMPARQTVQWAASNAAPLDPTASAANARKFLNTMRRIRRYCNAGQVNAYLCNEGFILGIAAALVYAQSTGNYLDTTKDQWDQEWVNYLGVPLIDMGYSEDLTTEILTTTEVAGDSGADSMSIYAVSFNTNDGVYGIQLDALKSYDPLGGSEMESKPSKMRRIDWWNGIANFGTRGIVRARNLERIDDWTEA